MNDEIEDEKTLINEKTNEEFSMRRAKNAEEDTIIIMERAAKKRNAEFESLNQDIRKGLTLREF